MSYYFKVIATNAVSDSDVSSQSDLMIAAIVPSVPLTFVKQSSTRNSITVQWSSPSDAGGTPVTAFKVYGNSGGSDTTFAELIETDATTFTF